MTNKTNKREARPMPEGFRLRMTAREARAVVAVLKAYRGYKCRENVCRDVASILERQIREEAGEG